MTSFWGVLSLNLRKLDAEGTECGIAAGEGPAGQGGFSGPGGVRGLIGRDSIVEEGVI